MLKKVQKIIRNLFKKFERTGSVAVDLAGNVGCSRSVMIPENVKAVEEIVTCCPRKSYDEPLLNQDCQTPISTK